MSEFAAMVRVREAIEDGDRELALAIVDGLLRELRSGRGHSRVGVECAECGRWFRWPGLRDVHLCSGRGGFRAP